MDEAKQKKVDKSLEATFPASDPPASRRATGTEPPGRPASRQAPRISKEQIEAAAGRPAQGRPARKPDRGVGRDGRNPGDASEARSKNDEGDEHGRQRKASKPQRLGVSPARRQGLAAAISRAVRQAPWFSTATMSASGTRALARAL